MCIALFFIKFFNSSVEIYADVIQGSLRVISNGADGFPGQDGAPGVPAGGSLHEVTLRKFSFLLLIPG